MERMVCDEMFDGSRSCQTGIPGTLNLKNFIIPRKKHTSGEVLLERCPEESGEYKHIQLKLREAKLDSREDQANSWLWKDVFIIYNQELLKKFSGKRTEMRAKGRHGREMEERFCFLAVTDQATERIYRHGLRIGRTTQHALGKPSHGVYLFMHVDVALKFASTSGAKKLLIFRVVYGKVKKISPCLDWKKTQDPTLGFDCHKSKDPISYRDSLHQQVLGSSVFLFDFNEKLELNERPRQCLPYAVVSFVPVNFGVQVGPVKMPCPPSRLPTNHVHGLFKAFNVAERREKRKAATATFRHFGTPSLSQRDHAPKTPRIQNGLSFSLTKNSNPEASTESEPITHHPDPSQRPMGTYKQIIDSTLAIPQSLLDTISTKSRNCCSIRQEPHQPNNCSKTDLSLICKPSHPIQEDKLGETKNDSIEPSSMEKKVGLIKPSMNVHTTQVPSLLLSSKDNLRQKNSSPQQKQEVADRLPLDDVFYRRYKEGLSFQNEKQTKTLSLSHIDPTEKILEANDNTDNRTPDDAESLANKNCTECSNGIREEHPKMCPLEMVSEKPLIPGPSIIHISDPTLTLQLDIKCATTKDKSSPCKKPSSDSAVGCGSNIPLTDVAGCVEDPNWGVSKSCHLSSVSAEKQQDIEKGCYNLQQIDSCETLPDLISTQELYKRISNLLAYKYPPHIFSSKAYLSPRAMLSPTNLFSQPKVECQDIFKAEKNLNMNFCKDRHLTVTLNANKISTNTKKTLSLSDRFSQSKMLRKKQSKHDHKFTETQRTPKNNTKEYEESTTCNAELIQRLAQKYNQSKGISKKFRRGAILKKKHKVKPPGLSQKRGNHVDKSHLCRSKMSLTENNFSSSISEHQDSVKDLNIPNFESAEIYTKLSKPTPKAGAHLQDTDEDSLGIGIVHGGQKTQIKKEKSLIKSHTVDMQTSMASETNINTITLNTEPITGKEHISRELIAQNELCGKPRESVVNVVSDNKLCLEISNNGSCFQDVSNAVEVSEDTATASNRDTTEVCTQNDLIVEDPAMTEKCMGSDMKTYFHIGTKSPISEVTKDDSSSDESQTDDANSAESQLISKLRDYLTKFESTVKKQDTVTDDVRERPMVWITLDSTAHKQQFFEKGQCCMMNSPHFEPKESEGIKEIKERSVHTWNDPESEQAHIEKDVCLLVPEGTKVGNSYSESKQSRNDELLRKSSASNVSPDSTSAIDSINGNGQLSFSELNKHNSGFPEISRKGQMPLQRQQQLSGKSPTLWEQKSKDGQSVRTLEINYDEDVSSTLAERKYTIVDISNTLKEADQTVSMSELEMVQRKCKQMLQQFIFNFELDQKMPFKETIVSRCLILEQYLDHPPAQVELKYNAVNSYLELQMMMEALEFVENKINFLRCKPTFRSLLWYDPSLYGELFKGNVGFQQQSSLFASFQKVLAQDGYSKLQEYYNAVSSLHHQLHGAPDSSYYMFLKSKRELLEAEAALRNPHDMKSFFLSVPISAMINFGNSLEELEKVHKVMMSFVETPMDQLPGTFDVGKAEHLSITCRYLQEKILFVRSSIGMLSKISWFGIEHLLYDASKVLIWQDREHSAPSKVLETYKNSNPQILFGVMESRVVRQRNNYTQEDKCLPIWMSSKPCTAQSISSDNELAYKLAANGASYPPVQQNMVDPVTHVENPITYSTVPHWEHSVTDGNGPNRSSGPHVYPAINSHPLAKRQKTFSNCKMKRSLEDLNVHQRPSEFDPQATLPRNSRLPLSGFETGKYPQLNTVVHRPQEQGSQFSFPMMPPYSLPNFRTRSPPIIQAHPPVPRTVAAIPYPYFLLNGQMYSLGSQEPVCLDARYYPTTI